MTRIPQRQRNIVCCLCVVLALVCAFSLILPRCHSCDHLQCPLCAHLSRQEHFLVVSVTISALCFAQLLLLRCNREDADQENDSPVRLKVKLSN